MSLKDDLLVQGGFLFRWRSYLPFLLLPTAIAAAAQSGYFTEWFGEAIDEIWDVIAVLVSFIGLSVRAFVVGVAPPGTSGRTTTKQRAEVLNVTGLYSIVRNPLYLGNFVILLGFLMAIKVWWFALMACLAFALYYERIILAEEAFLESRFGATYRAWASRTPIFVPNPKLWCRPERAFSLRTVLRREYNGFYLIVVVSTAIEFATDFLGDEKPVAYWIQEDASWLVYLAFGTVIFLTLRWLRKGTRLLHDPNFS